MLRRLVSLKEGEWSCCHFNMYGLFLCVMSRSEVVSLMFS